MYHRESQTWLSTRRKWTRWTIMQINLTPPTDLTGLRAAHCNKPIMLTLRCASGCKLTRVKEDFWCWLDLQVSLNFWSFWSNKHIIYMTSLKVVERQPAWQLSVRNLGFILRNGSTQSSRLATIILQYHITSSSKRWIMERDWMKNGFRETAFSIRYVNLSFAGKFKKLALLTLIFRARVGSSRSGWEEPSTQTCPTQVASTAQSWYFLRICRGIDSILLKNLLWNNIRLWQLWLTFSLIGQLIWRARNFWTL